MFLMCDRIWRCAPWDQKTKISKNFIWTASKHECFTLSALSTPPTWTSKYKKYFFKSLSLLLALLDSNSMHHQLVIYLDTIYLPRYHLKRIIFARLVANYQTGQFYLWEGWPTFTRHFLDWLQPYNTIWWDMT